MKLDMDKYLEQSQLGRLWLSKLKAVKNQFKATVSNLMRALLLYEHGGSYLDMDTISIKPFPKDIANFVIHGKMTCSFHLPNTFKILLLQR